MTTKFKGVVGGVTYTDTALFEEAAFALGFRHGGGRVATWKIGTAVSVRLYDGTRVLGQVWSKAATDNYVWVALDNGTYVVVNMQTRKTYNELPKNKRMRLNARWRDVLVPDPIGKVAA